MNKDKIQKILEWYGYKKVKFEVQVDQFFYFRTENMAHESNFVLKVEVVSEGIIISLAHDDIFERYDVDFYDYSFDATFTFLELEGCMSLN